MVNMFSKLPKLRILILSKIDTLIDGKYIEEQRDITLKLRGSTNQRVLQRGIDF